MSSGFIRTKSISKLLKLKKRTKVIPGGTSGGKTFGILPVLIDRAIKTEGLEISVVSKSIPHLKKGALKDFKKIMRLTGRWNDKHWHGTDLKYTFHNDSYIEFFSAEDDGKVHGPRRNILYINECNHLKFETYHALQIRTDEEVWLDYNPTKDFWVDKELKDDPDAEWLTLTYKDNNALSETIVKEIEKAKEKAYHNPDLPVPQLFKEENIKNNYWHNWWKVYGLGLKGSLQGVVFENWIKGKFNPDNLQTSCGLDFGFSVDPDALIEVAIDRTKKKLYLKQLIYQKGLLLNVLAQKIKVKAPGKLIIADSAEARLIADLKALGINIKPVQKRSIESGVMRMQDFEIIVDPDSTDLINEFESYIYSDKPSKMYVDEDNHGIDATRYNVDFHLDNPNRGSYAIK